MILYLGSIALDRVTSELCERGNFTKKSYKNYHFMVHGHFPMILL